MLKRLWAGTWLTTLCCTQCMLPDTFMLYSMHATWHLYAVLSAYYQTDTYVKAPIRTDASSEIDADGNFMWPADSSGSSIQLNVKLFLQVAQALWSHMHKGAGTSHEWHEITSSTWFCACKQADNQGFQEKIILLRVLDAEKLSSCIFEQYYNLSHGLTPAALVDVPVSIRQPNEPAFRACSIEHLINLWLTGINQLVYWFQQNLTNRC